MDGPAAGDLCHRVPGRRHSRCVGVEVEVALLFHGVAPGDREDLLALTHEELHHAPVRCEIEDVVLVDRRRDEQQRHSTHRLGLRVVLDELEDIRAQHHASGCRREVAADLESACVDGGRQPRRARHVSDEIAHSVDQVRATAIDRLLEHRRVGQQEVCRSQTVDEIGSREPHLTFCPPVDPSIADEIVNGAPDREIALQEPAEDPVVPRRIGEPPVTPGRGQLGATGRDPAQFSRKIAHAPDHGSRAPRQLPGHPRHLAGRKEVRGPARRVGEHDLERCARDTGARTLRRTPQFWSRLA